MPLRFIEKSALSGLDRHIVNETHEAYRFSLADDGVEQRVLPGLMWMASKADRFTFTASRPTRLICVFSPAFRGTETGFAGDR
jgi:hypothetical protein